MTKTLVVLLQKAIDYFGGIVKATEIYENCAVINAYDGLNWENLVKAYVQNNKSIVSVLLDEDLNPNVDSLSLPKRITLYVDIVKFGIFPISGIDTANKKLLHLPELYDLDDDGSIKKNLNEFL